MKEMYPGDAINSFKMPDFFEKPVGAQKKSDPKPGFILKFILGKTVDFSHTTSCSANIVNALEEEGFEVTRTKIEVTPEMKRREKDVEKFVRSAERACKLGAKSKLHFP